MALLALVLLSAILAPGTLQAASLSSMLPFAAVLAIASVGQALVIQHAGIDLSIPGCMSMTAVIVTQFPHADDGRLALGVALALAAAAAAGAVNGIAVCKLGLTPIVVTLGTNAVLLGVVRAYSGGVPASAAPRLSSAALDETLGIPHTVLVAVLVAATVSAVLHRTVAGRRFVAVGIAPHSARASGLHTDTAVVGAYVAAALCYATAAILLAGYVRTPSITSGDPYLLAPIAAVVIGGSALGHGRTSVAATVGGALFLSQLGQLILGLGAPAAVQLLVQAAVIAVAVGVRRVPLRRVPLRPRRALAVP
jgi:ribose transport system permease protein